MPSPQAQVKLSRCLRHVWRFVRLWGLATAALLLSGSSFDAKTASIAAAVGLGEVLYRLGVPSVSLTELRLLLTWVHDRGHAEGVKSVAQVALKAESAVAPVQTGEIDAANEPPLVNGQPQ